MTRTVFLHIGAPKTGTTYLQDRLTLNATRLADHGVHFPARSPVVSPGLFQFRAALDLLGQDWGGPSGHAEGNWEALVRRIRRRSGSVIVSHEILAPARPDAVARAMSDLHGSEVHVVYTARDLARQLPAAWQESIKQGRKWRYRRFLAKAHRGHTWFSRAFDIPAVLGTWGTHVPPENIHLVTVPKRRAGAGDDPLWNRFCEATRIDPAWAPEHSHRANESLGVAEAAVLRGLNKRLDRQTRREAPYDALIREMLAEQALVGRESRRIVLPPDDFDWVEERTGRWLEWIEQSGIDVVGDLDDLRPVRPAPDEEWHDPDRVRARRRLAVAMDALAAMTTEAASRPGHDRTITSKLRRNAERLRPR
jgi:hypothetical protein